MMLQPAACQASAVLWAHSAACLRLARQLHASPPRDDRESTPTTHTPPMVPDQEDNAKTGGRSSETVSVRPVRDPRLKRLIDDVFLLYEERDMSVQQRIIRRHYAPDAVYQNNIMRIQGTDAITRRFSLLPRATKSVRVLYETPVVLGATATSPDALDNLGFKGDLEVEIKNSQHYEFLEPGLLRLFVTPRTDVELPVLTRLALDKGSLRVLHHQDVWLNKASIWGPLRKGWGAIVTAATPSPPPPGDDPGHQPRRPRRAEQGEQSEEGEEEATERVGGRGGGRGTGGRTPEGEDSGLKREPPGVEPVPA